MPTSTAHTARMTSPPRYRRPWLVHGTGRVPGRRGVVVAWCDADGRVMRRTLPDRATAMMFMASLTRQLNPWLYGNVTASPPTMQWTQAVAAYLESLATRSRDHRDSAARILRELGDATKAQTPRDITADLLDRWLAAMTRARSPATAAKRWRYVRGFLRWCASRQIIAADPSASVRPPRVPQRIRIAPTWHDVLRLLCAVPRVRVRDRQGWHLLLLVAATTGARRSAILGMRWNRIVRREASGVWVASEKGSRDMMYGLPAVVLDRLDQRRADLLAAGLETAGPLLWRRWPRRGWDTIRRRARWRHAFHALRAMAGTQAAMLAAMRTGALALGHSDPGVFAVHYADRARICTELASSLRVPRLPSMPAACAAELLSLHANAAIRPLAASR